jgi:pimeloyl-ACP methyl ester carboxylesterase
MRRRSVTAGEVRGSLKMLKQVDAGVLRVAYVESGSSSGTTVILLHGFPYDVHAYDAVTPPLVAVGCRVITPYLRGFGPTRFLSANTPRSGQQAALAHDLLSFMDALGIQNAVFAGYDWGGRAACIVAALWPERVRADHGRRLYNSRHPGVDTAQDAGE